MQVTEGRRFDRFHGDRDAAAGTLAHPDTVAAALGDLTLHAAKDCSELEVSRQVCALSVLISTAAGNMWEWSSADEQHHDLICVCRRCRLIVYATSPVRRSLRRKVRRHAELVCMQAVSIC